MPVISFPYIANAALPHGSGADRVLAKSDYILIDCGGELYGYHSDVTRVTRTAYHASVS